MICNTEMEHILIYLIKNADYKRFIIPIIVSIYSLLSAIYQMFGVNRSYLKLLIYTVISLTLFVFVLFMKYAELIVASMLYR